MVSKKYSIRFTPLAYEDLEEIDFYISDKLSNPQAAENLMLEIEKQTMRLGDFPYTGSNVDDVYLSTKGYRKLVVQNYIIFYLINEVEKTVFIMRVLYGAREYHNLL